MIVLIGGAIGLAVLLLALLSYWHGISQIKRRRTVQRPISRSNNQRVSNQTLAELSHSFIQGETAVEWSDRMHPLVLWLTTGFPLALSTLCFGISWRLLVHPVSYRLHTHVTYNQQVHNHSFGFGWLWLLSLPAGLVLLAMAWNSWLHWWSTIRLVTDMHLRTEFQPPAFAFWLWNDEEHDPQLHSSIASVESEDTFLGNVLGYGTVVVRTYQMSKKDPAKVMRFARNHAEFARLLSQQAYTAREQTGGPAAA